MDAVQTAAARLRFAYTLRKRAHLAAIHGHTDWTPHAADWSVFCQVAEACLRAKVSPEEVVNVAFDATPPSGVLPRIAALKQPKYLQAAADTVRPRCERLDKQWQIEAGIFRTALLSLFEGLSWPDQEIWRTALLDETIDVSPLMRYCLAKDRKLNKVAKYFFEPAVLQYMRHREAYLAAWQRYIPVEFDQKAMKHYTTLYLQGGGYAQ